MNSGVTTAPDTAEVGRITALLESHPWIFARTMPRDPHWYSLRKAWEDDQDFIDAVLFIRRHGATEEFKGRPYVVLTLGGFKYWTMGAPIGPAPYNPRTDTVLINRARVPT